MEPVLQISAVSKSYGRHVAIRDVTLSLQQGEFMTLLGLNGAGKSTLVSMIAGLRKPSAGSVRVMGGNPRQPHVRRRIGCMFQEVTMLEKVRVGEVIRLFQSYYDRPLPYDRILQLSGLADKENVYATSLSGGQTRRLQFAISIVGDPDILILDEPTTGMDIESKIRFWDQLRTYTEQGKSMILTTHDFQEVQDLTQRIAILRQGSLVYDGDFKSLHTQWSLKEIRFHAKTVVPLDTLTKALGSVTVERTGDLYTIKTNDTDACLAVMYDKGWVKRHEIHDIEVHGGRLEQAVRAMLETSR